MIAGGRTDLRRILTAYTINELGTWFGYIALAVAVYDETHSAIAVGGMFVAARVLPAFAVPALVAKAETSTRRGALSALYLVEGVATIALGFLLWHFWLPGVLILVAVDGTAALAANALLRAAAARAGAAEFTDRDPEEGERRANAALNVAFSVSVALGPALAGMLVTTWGASTVLFIDAASFFACGMLLLYLRPRAEDIAPGTIASRIRDAWRYVREAPPLGSLLLAQGGALVFFTSVEPIEVLYVRSSLHAGTAAYGAIVAIWGLGMVFGSLLFRRWVQQPLGLQLVGGTVAIGGAYVCLAAAPSVAFACGVALVGGAGNGVQWASFISAVQRLTKQSLHAQLMGAVESIGSLAPAVGFTLGAVIAAVFDPRAALLVAGLGAGAIALFLLPVCRHDFGLSTESPGNAPEEPANAVHPGAHGRAATSKASAQLSR